MQTTQNKKFHNQSHREVRTQPSLFCYAIFYSSFIIPYIFRFENFPIKKKKAIKDKGKGTTLTAYNKKAEIANSSGKKYIEEFYNNPGKLHRLEVHLNNDEVKEYLNRTKQELSFYSLIDNRFLYDLFDQTLNSLIRFEYKGIKLDWDDLLLGVITTTPEEDSVLKLTSSKRTKKVA